MHIAYSALPNTEQQIAPVKNTGDEQLRIRYKAYQTACNKYSKEIAAIQKYIPGWVPNFLG